MVSACNGLVSFEVLRDSSFVPFSSSSFLEACMLDVGTAGPSLSTPINSLKNGDLETEDGGTAVSVKIFLHDSSGCVCDFFFFFSRWKEMLLPFFFLSNSYGSIVL